MIYFLGLIAITVAFGLGYLIGAWDEADQQKRYRALTMVYFRPVDDKAPSGSKLSYTTIEELLE